MSFSLPFLDIMPGGIDVAKLTKSEVRVINLVKLGKANKQIGKELCITENTVKKHVSAILRTLEADDRAHAVYISLRDGLIGSDSDKGVKDV